MACFRDATVHEVLSWNGSHYYWDITFTRSLNDWKEESILNLLSLLPDLNVDVHPEGEDKIVWSLDFRGIFSVKSLCEKMLGSNLPNFLAKASWKSKAPMKACFLAWTTSKGKVPTEVALKKRNFNLVSRCAMCLEEEESVDHLFVRCHWISSLWF